jgi:hypothetical protein
MHKTSSAKATQSQNSLHPQQVSSLAHEAWRHIAQVIAEFRFLAFHPIPSMPEDKVEESGN